MHKYIVTLFFIFSFFITFYLLQNYLSEPVVKFFPIDEQASISEAKTELTFDNDRQKLSWITESTSSAIAYLRQDISLLYRNGTFIGRQKEWRQHVDYIIQSSTIKPIPASLFQSISFHHGEIHHPDNQISSVQTMTGNRLYLIQRTNNIETFTHPHNPFETKWKKKLDTLTDEKLCSHWTNLITHFNINVEEYNPVPLTELLQYTDQNLPKKNKLETEKIIGQLWEGLYENYVLRINPSLNHYIPLIMFAKEGDHLLVVFEMDDEKQMLIQQFSSSNS